ncbi:MAG: D-alanyl-D-alanine carboxypeptidase [Clostridia bacterium]|jgi:D-alanyl-D-alanine carboxypeptidase|nr:D-alanyl-D-alanine carboxypeptidase [Clostridia bacterium]
MPVGFFASTHKLQTDYRGNTEWFVIMETITYTLDEEVTILKRNRKVNRLKRFIYIGEILLVLCVWMVSLVRYADSECDMSVPNESVQSRDEALTESLTESALPTLPTREPRESALPASESSASVTYTSKSSKDVLLVNTENPLPEDFHPENLVNLYIQRNKHFQLAKADIEVCETVFDSMEAMFAAAQSDSVSGFIITSGYRSYEEQKEIYSKTTDGTAAKPGTSEHETGLAFDVTAMGNENFELTPQFEWLSKHCAEYGFVIRYPKGMEDVTGYPYEPWHYRYVGVPYAKEIMDESITLEEYQEQH